MKELARSAFFGVCIISLVFFAVVFAVAIMGENKGIIALEEYPEGVAFCGEEFTFVISGGKDHTWYDKASDITYVVNEGHIDDPQVAQLKVRAEKECALLAKE